MIRAILFTFILVITQAFPIVAQKMPEYTGKLDAQLSAARPSSSVQFTIVKAEEKSKLPASIDKDAQVFTGELKWANFRKPGHQLLLIQSPGKPAYIFVDMDKNGEFSTEERFAFSPFENMKVSESDGEVVVHFPLPSGPYKRYPVRLRHRKADTKQGKEGQPSITQSYETYATGTFEAQGRKTRVQYQVNSEDGSVTGQLGYLGMDSDSDGKIDDGIVAYESAFVKNETVIFRVGERYFSTRSVNPERGEFTVSEHPASDYKRIELRIGVQVPDFNFTDFQGQERRLSEFRGKYVLLDFWGTWCGPCINEVPHLKKAYSKYRSRGFEILGMDEDKEAEHARKFITEQGISWTNATPESITELVHKRLRIIAFPTTILLDPQGKIISLNRKDQLPLRDVRLMETLEKLLPAQ